MTANDASNNKPRSFLFVLWEGGGNVPPILSLAQRLVERGHRARVISDPCNEPEVRAAGCEFVAYTRAPHRADKSAESTLVKDYEARNPLGGLRIVLDKMACGPALDYATDVLGALDDFPADAVVVSELLFGGCIAAEAVRLPCAMVIPGTYTFPAPGMPPPGMMPAAGVVGWVQGKLADIVFNRAFAQGLPALDRARSALGLRIPMELPAYLRDHLARMLVLTSPAFDFPARLPANVRYVGPVLDDPLGASRW